MVDSLRRFGIEPSNDTSKSRFATTARIRLSRIGDSLTLAQRNRPIRSNLCSGERED